LLTFPLLSLTRQSIGLARLVLDDPRLLGLSLLGQLVLGGGFRLPSFLSGGLGKILGFACGPFATQHSKAPGLLDLIYRLIRHQRIGWFRCRLWVVDRLLLGCGLTQKPLPFHSPADV